MGFLINKQININKRWRQEEKTMPSVWVNKCISVISLSLIHGRNYNWVFCSMFWEQVRIKCRLSPLAVVVKPTSTNRCSDLYKCSWNNIIVVKLFAAKRIQLHLKVCIYYWCSLWKQTCETCTGQRNPPGMLETYWSVGSDFIPADL